MMKNLVLKTCFFSSLFITGVAHAMTSSCDEFKVNLDNQLSSKLLITDISVDHAKLTPGILSKIDGHSNREFTVHHNKESLNNDIYVELKLRTIDLPTKSLKIKFHLTNLPLVCMHSDNSDQHPHGLEVSKSRGNNSVTYTISK